MDIVEGKHQCRITGAQLTEAQTSPPKPVIEVVADVWGGPSGIEETAPVSIKKTYWLGDNVDAYDEQKRPEWQVSLEKLRKLGFKGDDITQLASLVGFAGACGVKIKNGYADLAWIGTDGAKLSPAMPAAKAASFAEQMKARIQAMGPAKTGGPPQRTQPKPASKPAVEPDFTAPDTSDVPF